MSHAVYWSEETAEPFRPRLPGALPSAMTVSLAIAVAAMALSGTAVAWKWAQYDAIDTAAIAWEAPVQVSLPPEDFADAQVIHGRLVVLTPPAYAVPVSAQVQSPELASALESAAPETTPEATMEVATPTEDEAEPAGPETTAYDTGVVSADPLPASEDSF